MEMEITFPGGKRVDAQFGPFRVETDQPVQVGGEGSAPTPFATFLASIGTCAGIYVLGFLNQRGISSEGVRIIQRMHSNPLTGMVEEIDLDIVVPPDFPDKYSEALVRTAELCAVKKHFENPPSFRVSTKSAQLVVS
jgi:ribosomal protein S12 methylthiotransferase accessory factor